MTQTAAVSERLREAGNNPMVVSEIVTAEVTAPLVTEEQAPLNKAEQNKLAAWKRKTIPEE